MKFCKLKRSIRRAMYSVYQMTGDNLLREDQEKSSILFGEDEVVLSTYET